MINGLHAILVLNSCYSMITFNLLKTYQINKDSFSKYAAHAYSILMWINLRCQVTFFLTYCDAVLRRTLITNSRVFSAHRLSVTRSTKLTSARALFEVNKAARIFGAVVPAVGVAKCRFIALLYLHLPNDGSCRYFSI